MSYEGGYDPRDELGAAPWWVKLVGSAICLAAAAALLWVAYRFVVRVLL